jgi:PAS domain S-box-containing protein
MQSEPLIILLVEDEEAHAELVARGFGKLSHGFDLTIVNTLEKAKWYLKKGTPDLVISDMMLPDGHGIDLLDQKKGIQEFPMIVMTSYGNEEKAVQAIKLGALDYVVKSATTFSEMPRIAERALREWSHITERRLAEEALRKSEEKHKNIIETMEEGYFETDLAANVTTANKSIEETLGYSKSELMGLNIRAYMDQETATKVTEMYANIYKTGNSGDILSYEIINKNGEKRHLEVSTSVRCDPIGNPIGFSSVSRDVTDRAKVQELMIQTEKMMSVGGLAAGMAHELNNPLGGIQMGVQNVQRRLSPDLKSNFESAREFGIDLQNLQRYMEKRNIFSSLKGISDSVSTAAQIISSMLLFSRKSESNMVPVSLAKIMERSLNLAGKDYNFKKKFDFRNINIIKEFDSNLPPVPCAETEIEQVVLNLLKNAAQAMMGNDQTNLHRITLRLLKDGNMAGIEIEDNGPGMDDKIRNRVFEPFYTTKPVGEGTGLGLSVSYMIITNNHQGLMKVESELGKGTKFSIQLPLHAEKTS